MKKLFEKNETLITILLITCYIVLNLFCINTFDFKGLMINGILSLIIILFILFNKLGSYFGLTRFPNPKKYLYFIPLFILMSLNLWGGINRELSVEQIISHVGMMIFVGFLEEIIFRGFLFKLLEKDSLKLAVVVTTITFGIGHILNLFNGSDLIPTLIQICYTTATGYLFAILLIKGKSLWPCIITHSVVNSLSVFVVDGVITTYIGPIILTVVPIIYSIYLNKTLKD